MKSFFIYFSYSLQLKLARIHSCSQSSSSSIDSNNSMSSRDILSDECQSSPLPTRRHSITTTDASDINSDVDKSSIFEIERNTYKKKVQVKTKQEDLIYSTNKSSSPHRVRIHQSSPSPSLFRRTRRFY
jgi:hypothetical protein